MRKSAFGDNTYLWEGMLPPGDVLLHPVDSMHTVKADDVRDHWAVCSAKNPKAFDGKLWRYERHVATGKALFLDVSPTTWAVHEYTRKSEGLPLSHYANPVGVNTLQETADGYLVLGHRATRIASLDSLGSGFVDRTTTTPESVPTAVMRECHEETLYSHLMPLRPERMRVIGLVVGAWHDVGIITHVPLDAQAKDIALNGDEHSALYLTANRSHDLEQMVSTAAFHDGATSIAIEDPMRAALERYLISKEQGMIKSSYQHI